MPGPGARLKAAWRDRPIMIPGAFNALSARIAQRLGYKAVYLSGGALSAGWAGLPDIGLLTLSEFAQAASMLAQATSLPVLCDADTGFGEAVNVTRTIRAYENAGAAGLHLEDQILPKRCGHLSGKALISVEAMAEKVRAAVSTRVDPDFVVVARTDARSVEGFDAAVARARAYLDAGADAIFPEALESEAEFASFSRAVPAPLVANMTEFGRGPLLDFDALAAMGYKAVIYPLTAFRAAMRAAEETLEHLMRSGSQRDHLDRMQTRAELYERLGYAEWEDRDRAMAAGTRGRSNHEPTDREP